MHSSTARRSASDCSPRSGLIVALIIVIAVIGVTGGNSQSSASTALSQNVRSTREAMQVKFRAADFNGWQTAYAFDVSAG